MDPDSLWTGMWCYIILYIIKILMFNQLQKNKSQSILMSMF